MLIAVMSKGDFRISSFLASVRSTVYNEDPRGPGPEPETGGDGTLNQQG